MKKSLTIKRLFHQIVFQSMQQLLLVFLFSGIALSAPVAGQHILDKKISFQVDNVTLEKALHQLEKAVPIKFSYNSRSLPLQQPVTLQATNEELSRILDKLLAPFQITYKQVRDQSQKLWSA